MKKVFLTCLLLLFAGNALAWNCQTPCPKGGKPHKECLAWKENHCRRADPLDEWGAAGAQALPAAARAMEQKHKRDKYLDEKVKHALLPIFGDIIDQLKITWNARLEKQWAARGHHIPLSGAEQAAQVYGKHIYMAQPESVLEEQPGKTLALLIHAITHAQQINKSKGLDEFGDKYFRAYKQANLDFDNNIFEQRAENEAQKHWKAALKNYEDARCLGVPNVEIHTRGRNETFSKGKTWLNCAGYKLVFQGDGNLVLYGPGNAPLWATGTVGAKADRFIIQADGNVVLYAGDRPLWATDTQGRKNHFAIQEDGNMVVYSRERRVLWASGTQRGRKQTLNAAAQWQRKHAPAPTPPSPNPPKVMPPIPPKPPVPERLPFFR